MASGNGISGLLNFKIFWGGMPPDPPRDWRRRRASGLPSPPAHKFYSYGHDCCPVIDPMPFHFQLIWISKMSGRIPSNFLVIVDHHRKEHFPCKTRSEKGVSVAQQYPSFVSYPLASYTVVASFISHSPMVSVGQDVLIFPGPTQQLYGMTSCWMTPTFGGSSGAWRSNSGQFRDRFPTPEASEERSIEIQFEWGMV